MNVIQSKAQFETTLQELNELLEGQHTELKPAQYTSLLTKKTSAIFHSSHLLLEHFNLLETYLTFIEKHEKYKGKKAMFFHDKWIDTLCSISFALTEEDDPDAETSAQEKRTVQRIHTFIQPRLNGPAVKTKRQATVRANQWRVIQDFTHLVHNEELVDLAIKVLKNKKEHHPIVFEALEFLLRHEDLSENKDFKKAINSLQKSSKDHDTVSSILQYKVEIGEIDEFSALNDMEDF